MKWIKRLFSKKATNKQCVIHVVVVPKGTLPKCEHKHIIGGDGCFECADCGA